MVYNALQWAIFSLILITLIHYLYTYLQNMLTIPKVKDLVRTPEIKYNKISNTLNVSCTNKNIQDLNTPMLQTNNKQITSTIDTPNTIDTQNTIGTPNINKAAMKSELSTFLHDLKKSSIKTDNTLQNNIPYSTY